jgi:hypothetical protein
VAIEARSLGEIEAGDAAVAKRAMMDASMIE